MSTPDQLLEEPAKRSSPLTEEEVWSACNALTEARVTVSIPKVRHQLGDRGSNSTVSRYIDSWRAGVRAQSPKVVAPVPTGVEGPMRTLWEAARKEASEEFKEQIAEFDARERKLQERHEQDQRDLETARVANAQLQGAVASLREKMSALEFEYRQSSRNTVQAIVDLGSVVAEKLTALEQLRPLTDSIEGLTQGVAAVGEKVESTAAAALGREDSMKQAFARVVEMSDGQQAFVLRALEETRSSNAALSAGFGQVSAAIDASRKSAQVDVGMVGQKVADATGAVLGLREFLQSIQGLVSRQTEAQASFAEMLPASTAATGQRLAQMEQLLGPVSGALPLVDQRLVRMEKILADMQAQQLTLLDQIKKD